MWLSFWVSRWVCSRWRVKNSGQNSKNLCRASIFFHQDRCRLKVSHKTGIQPWLSSNDELRDKTTAFLFLACIVDTHKFGRNRWTLCETFSWVTQTRNRYSTRKKMVKSRSGLHDTSLVNFKAEELWRSKRLDCTITMIWWAISALIRFPLNRYDMMSYPSLGRPGLYPRCKRYDEPPFHL